MNDRELRVVKLGGSLLDLPDLAARLRRWLDGQHPMKTALLVGGGRLADAVREYDRVHALADEAAHWLAVGSMQLTARLVAALLPEAAWVESVARLCNGESSLSIVDPWRLLRADDRRLSPRPLPASWQVTSDSIAARLAELCGARELALLKSGLPGEASVAAAAAAGYVDEFFPQALSLPNVRCVNLRDDRFVEASLRVA